jgi:SAM-dependent methyltransferase
MLQLHKIDQSGIQTLKSVLDSNSYGSIWHEFKYKSKFTILDFLGLIFCWFGFNIEKYLENYYNLIKIKQKDRLYLMFKLFLENKKLKRKEIEVIIPKKAIRVLEKCGILKVSGNFVKAYYSIIPYENQYFLTEQISPFKSRNVFFGFEPFFFMKDIKNEINKKNIVIDVGTGYGCLAIFLAKKAKKVIGCDINKEAILLAKINARLNQIKQNKIKFIKADFLPTLNKVKHDVVVANPYPDFANDLIESVTKNINTKKFFMIKLGSKNDLDFWKSLSKKNNLNIRIKIFYEFPKYFFISKLSNHAKIEKVLQLLNLKNLGSVYIHFIHVNYGRHQCKIDKLYWKSYGLQIFEDIVYKLRYILNNFFCLQI